jgi:hypothetical protein
MKLTILLSLSSAQFGNVKPGLLNSSGSLAIFTAIRRASFRESRASLPTAANFGVSVQSTEHHEDEQRKSKRER